MQDCVFRLGYWPYFTLNSFAWLLHRTKNLVSNWFDWRIVRYHLCYLTKTSFFLINILNSARIFESCKKSAVNLSSDFYYRNWTQMWLFNFKDLQSERKNLVKNLLWWNGGKYQIATSKSTKSTPQKSQLLWSTPTWLNNKVDFALAYSVW